MHVRLEGMPALLLGGEDCRDNLLVFVHSNSAGEELPAIFCCPHALHQSWAEVPAENLTNNGEDEAPHQQELLQHQHLHKDTVQKLSPMLMKLDKLASLMSCLQSSYPSSGNAAFWVEGVVQLA